MSDFTVWVAPSIEDFGAEWDSLMTAARAPVFYRRSFLRAFELHPLHPVERTAYLLVVDRLEHPRAALPAYLQQGVDPMRVLADHFPRAQGLPVLISHVWHCFDTVLPTTVLADGAAATACLDALRDQAASWGAHAYGLANVDSAGPHSQQFAAAGLTPVDIDTAWGLDLTRLSGFEGYLETLKKAARGNLRRDLRHASDSGLKATFHSVEEADLDGFVRLARHTAEKYDNADYYRPGLFQDFVRALGNDVRVLELRLPRVIDEEPLVGSALALVDDTRLHFWACGVDYDACHGFSPFYIVFANLLQEAFRSGKPWFEGGRRNPVFKRRYGLSPRTLTAWLSPADEDRGPACLRRNE